MMYEFVSLPGSHSWLYFLENLCVCRIFVPLLAALEHNEWFTRLSITNLKLVSQSGHYDNTLKHVHGERHSNTEFQLSLVDKCIGILWTEMRSVIWKYLTNFYPVFYYMLIIWAVIYSPECDAKMQPRWVKLLMNRAWGW